MSTPFVFETTEGTFPVKESQSKYAPLIEAVVGLKPSQILKVSPNGTKPDELVNRLRGAISKKGYKVKTRILEDGTVLIGNVVKK